MKDYVKFGDFRGVAISGVDGPSHNHRSECLW